VYVLRSGREAVLIDFGSGAVLDRLGELGVDRVTDVLVTHHHRDQVQGLDRAVAAGARVWVPPVEKDLIAGVDRHRLRRPIDTDDWGAPDLETWRAYLELKPQLGVPALYYASHLDATGESFTPDDYEALRRSWSAWRASG
jgi:hypothetical protein